MIRHKDRYFVSFLEEYCSSRNIRLTSLPGDWVYILTSASRQHIVMGYDLGLNSSIAAKICNEKFATFNVLNACGVHAIPHHLFLPPEKRAYSATFGQGNWLEMLRLHESFGHRTVVKQNDGTGGHNVFLATDQEQLEAFVSRIFSETHNVALSPFSQLDREVRFIILNSNVLLCHEYVRPNVMGDGRSTVQDLMRAKDELFGFPADPTIDLEEVLPKGELRKLGFQRKVPGAEIFPVDADTVSDARQLAQRAFSSLGLNFASIDVVLTDQGWKVLEAHSGVMIEGPFRCGRISHEKLFSIYAAALDCVGF